MARAFADKEAERRTKVQQTLGIRVLKPIEVSKLLRKLDLRQCGMVIESKGEPICVGAGAAAMGNPLVAMLWLVRTMARVGRPLKTGDVVMSGSLGPMTPVSWGDVVEARISGLGSVRAAFAKE